MVFSNLTNKKAAIVVSFSWVIMTIIGVIFLMIAYKAVGKYEEYSDMKIEIKYSNFLNNVLRQVGEGVGIKENSVMETNAFRDKEISMICSNDMPILRVDDIFLEKLNVFKTSVLFMHNFKFEKAENSYILTQRYDLPYVISNFVIISSNKQKIFIDQGINPDFLKSFKESAFDETNNEVVDFASLDNSIINNDIDKYGYKQVIFVGDYTKISSFNFNQLKTDVFGLDYSFSVSSDNFYVVDLTIEDKDSNTFNYEFVDYKETFSVSKASIFASPQNLNCSLNMITKLTDISLDFYKRKAIYLTNLSVNDKINCNLDDITRDELFEEVNSTLSIIQASMSHLDVFVDRLDDLQEQNRNINYKCKEDYTIY